MTSNDGRQWVLAIAIAVVAACSSTGQQRTPSAGTTVYAAAEAPVSTGGSGDALPANTATAAAATVATALTTGAATATWTGTATGTAWSPWTSAGTGTGVQVIMGSGIAFIPTATSQTVTAQTLESCEAMTPPSAWVPIVNNGSSPATCSGTLVNWCCTRSEIERQFPTYAQALETGTINGQPENFQTLIDQQNYVLYACSTNGANQYTFSLAKIVNGTTYYATIVLPSAYPSDPNPPTTGCPVVSTSSLSLSTTVLSPLPASPTPYYP